MIQDMNTPMTNEKKGEIASKMGKVDKVMKGEKKRFYTGHYEATATGQVRHQSPRQVKIKGLDK